MVCVSLHVTSSSLVTWYLFKILKNSKWDMLKLAATKTQSRRWGTTKSTPYGERERERERESQDGEKKDPGNELFENTRYNTLQENVPKHPLRRLSPEECRKASEKTHHFHTDYVQVPKFGTRCYICDYFALLVQIFRNMVMFDLLGPDRTSYFSSKMYFS